MASQLADHRSGGPRPAAGAEPPAASAGSHATFAALAARVATRLTAVHFARALKRTSVPVFGVAIAAAVALRLAGHPGLGVAAALGLVIVWMGGCAVWAALRRPEPFAALAAWDERSRRAEAFASAYFFESQAGRSGGLSPGERLHVEKSRAKADEAIRRLDDDLPLPPLTLELALPVVLLGLVLSPLFLAFRDASELPVTGRMAETAREEAEKLARTDEALDKLASLTDEEKERLEELRDAIDETAKELEDSEGREAGDVLDELEERAREAEKLARKLGSEEGAWASEAMLAEMSQHADTADLADAVRDKDAERSADESDRLGEKLKDDALTAEARDRIDEALGRTMRAATEEDREMLVGRHVGAASENLDKQDPRAAGTEFEELAEQFRRIEERENARKELEQLADKLREAGSNIAGENLKGLEKLAGSEGGLEGSEGQQAEGMGNLSEMMAEFANQPLEAPGLQGQPMSQDAMQGMMTGSPVPGSAPQPGDMMAVVPGQGQPGDKMMLLPAPIPGTSPGEGAMVMVPGGAGAGAQSMVALPGGLQAGVGTSNPAGEATEAAAASQQGNVAAQINADGESTVRAVEGGTRRELATRSRRDMAVDFLNVQEEALDEQTLPLSRREHVLRYFNAIRRQFEGEE